MNNEPIYVTLYSEESEVTYTESVQYHSVGPDTFKPRSSHNIINVGDHLENSDYATAGMVGMDTEHYTYENPDTKVNMHVSTSYNITLICTTYDIY